MATVLLLTACAKRHLPPVQTVFRIESREGVLYLRPPAFPGRVSASSIAFSQIIQSQYGYNPWEQYVDLSPGMRLAVQQLSGQTQTTNSFYQIFRAGRSRIRMRSSTPGSRPFDKHARYMRLFYQNKFITSPGQPLRPALCLWSDSIERLDARTSEARQDPAFTCGGPAADCISFSGRTTVSPEVQITVNGKPLYVLLGSTVRDLLRSARAGSPSGIRFLRQYRNHLVPVIWEQMDALLSLPLVAADEISW